MDVIGRGAEAILYREGEALVKERIVKGYRVKELDEKLRKRRTRLEAKILSRAKRAGVPTPSVIKTEDYKIVMEFIEGKRLKELLQILTAEEMEKTAEEIGRLIGKLHSAGIIHGDLTTSNMILREKIYFIDFGLAFHSTSVEDRAVDLHLLHQAYQSTHFNFLKRLWEHTVEGYKETFKDWEDVLKRLEQIRKRGRYAKR